MSAERLRTAVAGTEIAYWRAGAGPTLVFLHGAGGIHGWAPWMDDLSRSYDVIVPDHAGWGDSPAPPWLENVHDIAYLYLDFFDTLRLENVHLVGNSIGGWIACEIAVKSTRRLATLTLAAPAGVHSGVPAAGARAPASPDESLRRLYFDKSIAERLAAEPGAAERAELQRRNRIIADRIAGQPRCYDPQLLRWMHRIDVPTLVLWGAEDEVLPHAHLAEFVRLIPGATGVTIRNAGHLPHVERAAEFAAAFGAFVRTAAAVSV